MAFINTSAQAPRPCWAISVKTFNYFIFFVNLGKSILGRRKKAKDSDDEESDDDEDEEDENADNEESDAATVDNSKKANPEKENDDSDDSTSKSSSKTGKDFEMVEKSTVDTADEEQDQP